MKWDGWEPHIVRCHPGSGGLIKLLLYLLRLRGSQRKWVITKDYLNRQTCTGILCVFAQSPHVILLFRLGATPPCAPCEPEVVFPLGAVFSLAFLMLTYFIFLLFLSFDFFDFDSDIVCFILSSCGYYAVSSVSVSATTRLAYDMYVFWYVRTLISPFYFCLRYTRLFQIWRVFSSVFFCFSSWGNLPLQSY